MVEPSPLLFTLLVVLLFIVCCDAINYSFEEKTRVLNLNNLKREPKIITSSNCLSKKSRIERGATILEMKHSDHCYGGTNADWNKRQQRKIITDEIRVKSLQSRIKNMVFNYNNGVSDTQIPLTSGIDLETLNYIVTIELGGRKLTVIVDTGSDLTWVQCQPCKSCYNQQDPLFNPSMSSSYQTVLCNSTTCQSLQFDTGNRGVCASNTQTCNYSVSYGDGSYTSGELGRENLNLGNTTVNDFVFGCGRSNNGLFGGVSGLMGLGMSNVSLVSQTPNIFGGVFSYCLPTTEAEASGSLVLGGNTSVYKNSTPISYTKMVQNPMLPTFYFINLTGISIGGVALESPSFGKSRFLIDSGTVVSRLPPSIYRVVRAEFMKQVSGFPSAPGYSILDTCFDLSGYEEVDIPKIEIQFEGNSGMTVDVTGVFYFVKTDASQVCLALASLSYEGEIGIIGNFQQKNQRVVYDTKQSMFGFAEEACSFE
ncbi:Eukaryotic aspartyl protease family protein [Tripterygium wilfordii]|uniref:Eukaryotic aspartyl protease family protein n=1 Tax=Tripterygium wilfordii TaxID=458696 RepID=A0A7J7CY38_TRIWF|nr:aspartyl protease family protein At5g10770 [Tripterygium wilfordii]KAF5739015.1 Eukaryotic aspartyl protease family protein [Tripterygium wilfordii]